YISANFRSPLDVKKLASVANLSEFHFHRIFKAETQSTPQKYIERLRLEYAAHVMHLNPQMKKIHLAFESGFQSPTSFNRSFKKYFGRSPSCMQAEYRDLRETSPPVRSIPLESTPLDICYLCDQPLYTYLLNPKESVIQSYIKSTPPPASEFLYGVFLDPPLHRKMEDCRYLLGIPVEGNREKNFDVEGGYYLRLILKGAFEENKEEILGTNHRLETYGYSIKYPLGIEKIKWGANPQFNYSHSTRELYIPITK
ncbi:MAG: AraC family transcriptional regulator, partial [Bacteroidota bacterium]